MSTALGEEVDYCSSTADDYSSPPVNLEYENRTIAKVYDPDQRSLEDYRGNAVVVDGRLGLLLTPRHVVLDAIKEKFGHAAVGASVDLVFKGFEGFLDKETTATVIAVLGETGTNGDLPKENQPRDLALLQINDEETRNQLRERRIAIGPSTKSFGRAIVQSYFANSTSLIEDQGTWAADSFDHDSSEMQCTYRLSFESRGGDSGAPVTDPQSKALTLGFILQKSSDIEKSYGIAIPAECLRDLLVTWMETHFFSEVENTAYILVNSPINDLSLLLRDPDHPNRPTNALLHAAIRHIVESTFSEREALGSGEDLDPFSIRWYCVIDTALSGREAKLPREEARNLRINTTEIATSLAEAESAQRAITGEVEPKSGPDALLQYALALQSSDPERSRRMAVLASLSYASTLGLNVSTDDFSLDTAPQFVVSSSTLQEAANTENAALEFARYFKGLSDSQMLAARLSDDNEFKSLTLATARGAALQAVWLAGDNAPAIASNSLITYADASSDLGDWNDAKEGYVAAFQYPGLEPMVIERALGDLGYVAGRAENITAITEIERLNAIIDSTTVSERLFIGSQNPAGISPLELPSSSSLNM